VPLALIRPGQIYAWKGPSLLLVNTRGECGDDDQLSGYYFREARFLRTLRLEINGRPPWSCEATLLEPDALAFTYIYPELAEFGGGGSGQSGDELSTDADGIPHRALSLRLVHTIGVNGLTVRLTINNHATRSVETDVAWHLDADFADIQEAHEGRRQQQGDVHRQTTNGRLHVAYQHPQLQYRTVVTPSGSSPWTVNESTIKTRLRLAPQEVVVLGVQAEPSDTNGETPFTDAESRELHLRVWRDGLTRVTVPPNRHAERILSANVRDFASFPLAEGQHDEWLTLQVGMPLYPALFGRDTLTAGWQAAYLDRGESLDASLTRLGRMQSDRVYDWRDEEPGRIPYQVRRGPLALLDLNPYSAYYADFASPLMFVISLAHLYSWTGNKSSIQRHYNPLSYHLGTVWAVEQATIAFGLRRFGFDTRALEIAHALFDLAEQYPEYRIPECIGGYPRGETGGPGAYPRANTPQLWNASAFPLLIHSILGFQPVALLDTLFVDPVLPTWLPELIMHDLRLSGATVTLRFWRDRAGSSHGEVLHKSGTFHLVTQPPLESLTAGVVDRLTALLDSVRH
jgi:glycogen debranching enzyme